MGVFVCATRELLMNRHKQPPFDDDRTYAVTQIVRVYTRHWRVLCLRTALVRGVLLVREVMVEIYTHANETNR